MSSKIKWLKSVITKLKLSFPNPRSEVGYPQKSIKLWAYLVICLCVWLNIAGSVLEFIVWDNRIAVKSTF